MSSEGSGLLCLSSRLRAGHLTERHGGNLRDYVSIMRAVTCLLVAAVWARCAETGESLPPLSVNTTSMEGESSVVSPPVSPVGLREWVRLEGRLPSAEERVQPKRLLQQKHSEEELLHDHLDTRVRDPPAGLQQVSLTCSLRGTKVWQAFRVFTWIS